jgi:hypothetical protein
MYTRAIKSAFQSGLLERMPGNPNASNSRLNSFTLALHSEGSPCDIEVVAGGRAQFAIDRNAAINLRNLGPAKPRINARGHDASRPNCA